MKPLIAITGGNGFIGRHLIDRLVGTNRVRVLTSSGSRSNLEAEYVSGDLLKADDSTLDEFLGEATALVHLAGMVSRDDRDAPFMMQLHIEGTRRLLQAMDRSSCPRLVLMSTSGVVGIQSVPDRPADDSSSYALEFALKWPYYSSKIYQEKLLVDWAASRDVDAFILRPSLVIGPGDTGFSSTGDIKRFLDGKLPGIPAGGLSFVDVRDVVDAIVACLNPDRTARPHRAFLLGAANMSFAEYTSELERLSGVDAPRMRIPPRVSVAAARAWTLTGRMGRIVADIDPQSADMANHFWYIDSSRAREELGWVPRKPETSLRDTIDFIRSHQAARPFPS